MNIYNDSRKTTLRPQPPNYHSLHKCSISFNTYVVSQRTQKRSGRFSVCLGASKRKNIFKKSDNKKNMHQFITNNYIIIEGYITFNAFALYYFTVNNKVLMLLPTFK